MNEIYTIVNFYENKSKTGVMLTCKSNKEENYIKVYVPYHAHYEDAPCADLIRQVNYPGAFDCRITVKKVKNFIDKEE